jgi:hypothetical protein
MLCDWVEHGATWLQPVVRQMKAELLAGDYLQVDETPVKVMDPEVKDIPVAVSRGVTFNYDGNHVSAMVVQGENIYLHTLS